MSFFSVFRRTPVPDATPEPVAVPASASAPSVLKPAPATPSEPQLPQITFKDISPARLQSRLEALVRLNSTPGQESAAIAYLTSVFDELMAEFPDAKDRFSLDTWSQDVQSLQQSIVSLDNNNSNNNNNNNNNNSPTSSTTTTSSSTSSLPSHEPSLDSPSSSSSSSSTPSSSSSSSSSSLQEFPNPSLPCVAIRFHGLLPGPSVILTGHVDALPAGPLPGLWKHPPFSAAVDDGCLFGRASSDMKAGLVAALEVFELFVRSSLSPAHAPASFSGSLALVFVSGDLDGALGTLSAVQRGYRADYVLLPKPTCSGLTVDPALVIAHAGSLTCRLSVEGRSASACKRMEGESALAHFITLYGKLNQAERQLNERETHPLMRELVLPYPTCVGRVSGGEWSHAVMERIDATVRFGVQLGESLSAAEHRVQQTVSDAVHENPWLSRHSPKIRVVGGRFPSSAVPADHPLVAAVAKAALRVHGRKAKVAGSSAGSAMGVWNNVAGSACVQYGPGDVRLSQAANEHIELRVVQLGAQVLLEAAVTLLGHTTLQRPQDAPSYEEVLQEQNDFLEREIQAFQERKKRSGQQGLEDHSITTSTSTTISSSSSSLSTTTSLSSTSSSSTTTSTTGVVNEDNNASMTTLADDDHNNNNVSSPVIEQLPQEFIPSSSTPPPPPSSPSFWFDLLRI